MDAKTTAIIDKAVQLRAQAEKQNLSIEQVRALLRNFFLPPELKMEKVANVIEASVPNGNHNIPLKIIIPEGKGPFPTLVYFHGGGWVFGSAEQSEPLCRRIANRAQVIVITVDYRLAPEHPFPQGVEDCYKATLWAAKNGVKYGGDPDWLGVGGDSAGGNLAAAVTLMARDKKNPHINFQLLLYPALESVLDKRVYDNCSEQLFLPYESMHMFWNSYLTNEQDKKNPYASPLYASNLKGLPPAFIVTAENDPLREEGEKYASLLKRAGVECYLKRYPEMIHGFLALPVDLKYTLQGIEDIAQKIKDTVLNRFSSSTVIKK